MQWVCFNKLTEVGHYWKAVRTCKSVIWHVSDMVYITDKTLEIYLTSHDIHYPNKDMIFYGPINAPELPVGDVWED
jgi:hypothetical protein